MCLLTLLAVMVKGYNMMKALWWLLMVMWLGNSMSFIFI